MHKLRTEAPFLFKRLCHQGYFQLRILLWGGALRALSKIDHSSVTYFLVRSQKLVIRFSYTAMGNHSYLILYLF